MSTPGSSKQDTNLRKRTLSQVETEKGIPTEPSESPLSHLFSDSAIAPWMSREEWLDVYNQLSPVLADPENAQSLAAVDVENLGHIIHSCWGVAWGARNDTANLTIQIVKALKALQSGDQTTGTMAGCMAVIRFVKTVSEPLTTRFRRPIMEICGTVGVPSWVVQIRHDGSHGDMHDARTVREALVFALKWLKERFWDVELKRIRETSYMTKKKGEDPQRMRDVPEEIIRTELRKKRRAVKKFESQSNSKLHKKSWLAALASLDVLIEKHLSLFTDILTSEFVAPSVLVLNSDSNDIKSDKTPVVPRKAETEWGSVVEHVMSHPGGTDSLLRSFASLLGDLNNNRDYFVAAWIHKILNKVPKNLVSSVRIWDAVNWTAFCDVVTSRPSLYQTGILQMMAFWVKNAKEHRFIQDSIRLAKIINAAGNGRFSATSVPAESPSLTADELLDVVELRSTERRDEENLSPESCWKLANDIDWKNCPIGLLPHQTSPEYNLYSNLLLPSRPALLATPTSSSRKNDTENRIV